MKANPLTDGATGALLSFSAFLPYLAFAGTAVFAVRKVLSARDKTSGARVVPLGEGGGAEARGPTSLADTK